MIGGYEMKYPTYKVNLTDPDHPEAMQEWEVYSDLMLDEADVLTNYTAKQYTWREWLVAVDEREPDALRFMYWLCRKRAGNPVEGTFSSITFYLHAMTVDLLDAGDFATEVEANEPIELSGPGPTEGVETAFV